MIIWSGFGFLVVVIVMGCALAANLISDATLGEGFFQERQWPLAISLIVSAALCWLLGDRLRKRSDRVVIDRETGEELRISRSNHSLFFVPVHWWGPVLFVIAVVLIGLDVT